MVIYIMGPPGKKSGNHTSRPIIARVTCLKYSSHNDPYSDRCGVTSYISIYQKLFPFDKGIDRSTMAIYGEDPLGITSWVLRAPVSRMAGYSTPSNRRSDQEWEEGTIDSLFEIERQKKVMLQVSSSQSFGVKVEISPVFDSDEYDDTPFQSLLSSWRSHQCRTPSRNKLLSSYIHESHEEVLPLPCRNDFLFAAENNPSPQSFNYIEGPVNIPLRVSHLSFDIFLKIEWDEYAQRSALIVQEERARAKFGGTEVAEYLILMRNLRCRPNFHEHSNSSIGAVRNKEKQYFEEGFAYRAKQSQAEHRSFMSGIPPERLPTLRLPSTDTEGQSCAINPVDYEVARTLAVEEKILRVLKEDKSSFFPGIL